MSLSIQRRMPKAGSPGKMIGPRAGQATHKALLLLEKARQFAGMRVTRAVCLLLALGSGPAWAQEEQVEDYEAPDDRRGGLWLGVAPSVLAGTAVGYPNELSKLHRAEFKADTGLGFGNSTSFWLGGALRDWLNVGAGATFVGLQGDDRSASGGAVILRLEGFPLYSLGSAWKDAGLLGEFGAGWMTIRSAEDEELAEGGSLSFIGLGGFYEALQFGHIALGPALQYSHGFSQTLSGHLVSLGLRASFYGSLKQ
jgi:hypothetical protein